MQQNRILAVCLFPGNVYKIEKVLKKRKRRGISESLVKWVGWKEPSWEKDKNIISTSEPKKL